jgi:hypothetical protein
VHDDLRGRLGVAVAPQRADRPLDLVADHDRRRSVTGPGLPQLDGRAERLRRGAEEGLRRRAGALEGVQCGPDAPERDVGTTRELAVQGQQQRRQVAVPGRPQDGHRDATGQGGRRGGDVVAAVGEDHGAHAARSRRPERDVEAVARGVHRRRVGQDRDGGLVQVLDPREVLDEGEPAHRGVGVRPGDRPQQRTEGRRIE